MTLLQLIAHLKEVYVEAGNCECLINRPEPHDTCMYLALLDAEDIEVDPKAKTITFT